MSFSAKEGTTRLSHLFHTDPLKVLFPTPSPGDIPQAAIATTSGGLVGGDWLELEFVVTHGASAMFLPQAAEKVYRSLGSDSRISVQIEVKGNCWLEWLPQETILFDGARLNRRTRLEVAAGGSLLCGEMLVFGRTARGEQLRAGLVRDSWEIRRDGQLAWAEAFQIDENIADVLAQPACLDGAIAMATAVLVADDATEWLEPARTLLGDPSDGVLSGVTAVNGILVMRWLAQDAQALRLQFAQFWQGLRSTYARLPAALPRLWHV